MEQVEEQVKAAAPPHVRDYCEAMAMLAEAIKKD